MLIRHFRLILIFSIPKDIIFVKVGEMQAINDAIYDGIQVMDEKHIDEVKQIMVDSYLQKNDVWAAFNLDRERLKVFFQNLIRTHLGLEKETSQKMGKELKLNHIFLKEGKLLAYILHYDSQDYKKLHENEVESDIDLFNALQKAAGILTKDVNFNYAYGETAYANFGGVPQDDSMTSKEKFLMLYLFTRKLRDAGYKKVIGRATNVRAFAMYKKLGATNMKEHQFEKDGKPITLYWFEIDLYNEDFEKILAMVPIKQNSKL